MRLATAVPLLALLLVNDTPAHRQKAGVAVVSAFSTPPPSKVVNIRKEYRHSSLHASSISSDSDGGQQQPNTNHHHDDEGIDQLEGRSRSRRWVVKSMGLTAAQLLTASTKVSS